MLPLRTDRLGFRFSSPETEADYRQWRTRSVLPFVRIGGVAAVLNWSIYLSVAYAVVPALFPSVLPGIAFIVIPTMLAAILLSYCRRLHAWVMPAAALANSAAGVVALWQISGLLDNPGLMTGTAIILAYFAFVIFRLPATLGLLTVAPYLGMVVFFLLSGWFDRRYALVDVAGCLAMLFISLMNGLLVCLVLEGVTRRSYSARRTIEDQRQALEQVSGVLRRYVPPAVVERVAVGDIASIEAPRRARVTVLFADIVGFTSLADRLDAESLAQMVNEYMAAMAEAVERHGGTLNEYAGDGMMALFGAPLDLSVEDQVLCAVTAARDIQSRMPELNERWQRLGIGEPFQIRIGINTGVVSVGSFGSEGRMTYTAIGLQTNIAARIQAQCQPGEILLSGSSWHAVKHVLPCEPRGELECRGVHFPVQVFSPAAVPSQAFGSA